MENVNVTIEMDKEMKQQADELFQDLGLNLSSAVIIFIKQALREQAIPFVVSKNMPNAETIEAIEETRSMYNVPNKKTYTTFRDFMKEMENEEI